MEARLGRKRRLLATSPPQHPLMLRVQLAGQLEHRHGEIERLPVSRDGTCH